MCKEGLRVSGGGVEGEPSVFSLLLLLLLFLEQQEEEERQEEALRGRRQEPYAAPRLAGLEEGIAAAEAATATAEGLRGWLPDMALGRR